MRVTQDWALRHRCVSFIDDLPGGGCLVQLPDGTIMNTDHMNNRGEPFYDLDGKEVFYPGWASW